MAINLINILLLYLIFCFQFQRKRANVDVATSTFINGPRFCVSVCMWVCCSLTCYIQIVPAFVFTRCYKGILALLCTRYFSHFCSSNAAIHQFACLIQVYHLRDILTARKFWNRVAFITVSKPEVYFHIKRHSEPHSCTLNYTF